MSETRASDLAALDVNVELFPLPAPDQAVPSFDIKRFFSNLITFDEDDIADGVLVCRHHHLLIHNNGWHVTRERAEYFFVPPPDLDPQQRPIPAQQRTLVARAG